MILNHITSSIRMDTVFILARCMEEYVHAQTHYHHHDAVYRQPETQPPEQRLAPLARPAEDAAGREQAAPAQQALVVGVPVVGEVVGLRLVIFLHEALVCVRFGRRDLIVEQSRENKADAGAAGAADVSQHGFQRRHGHGRDETQDENRRCDGCKANVAHGLGPATVGTR